MKGESGTAERHCWDVECSHPARGKLANKHSNYKLTTKQRDGSSYSPRVGINQPTLAETSLLQVRRHACLRMGSGDVPETFGTQVRRGFKRKQPHERLLAQA